MSPNLSLQAHLDHREMHWGQMLHFALVQQVCLHHLFIEFFKGSELHSWGQHWWQEEHVTPASGSHVLNNNLLQKGTRRCVRFQGGFVLKGVR